MIIGSYALNHYFPGVREPKDLDLIYAAERSDLPEGVDIYAHPRLAAFTPECNWGGWASIDELYTVKVSHAYWELKNNSWAKHMWDTVFLKKRGAKIIQPFHDLLYKCWEEKHGPKKMSFKEDGAFFKDAVTRIYDHDSIHDSVAFGSEAMYIQTLKRAGHTAVDMDYIKGMSHADKVLLFREEVAATALERILIPGRYMGSPGAAYLWALRRTITSLTKGWSAQFIVENYRHFMVPDNYLERHLANKEKLVLL